MLGSNVEQETAAQAFGLLNHAVELKTIQGHFQEACELAISVGLVEEALSLVEKHGAILEEPILATAINYVHAGRILSKRCNQGGRKDPSVRIRKSDRHPSNSEGRLALPLEQQWIKLEESIDRYKRQAEIPAERAFPVGILKQFFALVVCPLSFEHFTGYQSDAP
jgi:hypothetical protein